MRAVVCQDAALRVEEIEEPNPATGQVRPEVARCGICGSDLHARHGLDEWADMAERTGYRRFGRSTDRVVFGHEFSGRVAEYGPKCSGDLPTGTPVVALPLLRGPRGVDAVGPSPHASGAYAEQLLVSEPLMKPVPNGLSLENRSAHRAARRRLGCRPPRRGRQAPGRRRDRVRPGRPRRDPL